MKPTIVTLTGPSCAGKSTLEKMLSQIGMIPLISTTTRQPRPGEVDGVNYHFISKEEFTRIKNRNGFVEAVEFGGNSYGLSVKAVNAVTADNKPCVVVVEPHGREQIVAFGKVHSWKIHTVFVNNPPDVIAKRYLHRVVTDAWGAGRSYNPIEPVIESHAKRLATMLDAEAIWRFDAAMDIINQTKYKLIIDEFNAENASAVVEQVAALIDENWHRSDSIKAA